MQSFKRIGHLESTGHPVDRTPDRSHPEFPSNMKSPFLKPIISAGLFLYPALLVQASVDSFLKVDLKCYYQDKISSSASKESGKVKTLRLDSKQLLKILGKQSGVKYPGGSQLKVSVNGKVFVTDSKGNKLSNVSQYFQVDLGVENSLFDGKYYPETGKENSTNYFPISLTINLDQLQGVVQGIAIENLKIDKADNYGIQKVKGKTESSVNGNGSVEGGLAYYEGELKLDGKNAIVNP